MAFRPLETLYPTSFDSGFYPGGQASSNEVPYRFDVGINGRNYVLDTTDEAFSQLIKSVPFMRTQSDISSSVSEEALSRDSFWRKTMQSWHKGAGQYWWDLTNSDPDRFRFSVGINPWEPQQLSLLHDVTQLKADASDTNMYMTTAGSRIFATYGQKTGYLSGGSFTDLTGNPASNVTAITSTGSDIYVGYGANGIYTATSVGAALSNYVTGTVNLVRYVKGRLMVSNANTIYNVTSGAGAAITASVTNGLNWSHPNSSFTWVGFAEGPAYIYAAGYAGSRSIIYKTAVKADGTGLDIPVTAGELPNGEIVNGIFGYLGFLFIGSNQGLRMASIDSNGNLVLGALMNSPLRTLGNDTTPGAFTPSAFCAYDRFVWFDWNNFNGTNAGLGRIDLSQPDAGGTNVPAYSTDLQVSGSASTTGMVNVAGVMYFAANGLGIYQEDTSNYVAEGYVDSGYVTFGLVEEKTLNLVDIKIIPDGGTVSVAIEQDGDGNFSSVGSFSVADNAFPLDAFVTYKRAELFQSRITLSPSDDFSTSSTIQRLTLKGFPAPARSLELKIPILLADILTVRDGSDESFNPFTEFLDIDSLVRSQQLITIQIMSYTVQGTLVDYDLKPTKRNSDMSWFDGTIVITARTT